MNQHLNERKHRKHCQVICWDRGRPARNEREARTDFLQKTARLTARLRAGRPRSQQSLEWSTGAPILL